MDVTHYNAIARKIIWYAQKCASVMVVKMIWLKKNNNNNNNNNTIIIIPMAIVTTNSIENLLF